MFILRNSKEIKSIFLPNLCFGFQVSAILNGIVSVWLEQPLLFFSGNFGVR